MVAQFSCNETIRPPADLSRSSALRKPTTDRLARLMLRRRSRRPRLAPPFRSPLRAGPSVTVAGHVDLLDVVDESEPPPRSTVGFGLRLLDPCGVRGQEYDLRAWSQGLSQRMTSGVDAHAPARSQARRWKRTMSTTACLVETSVASAPIPGARASRRPPARAPSLALEHEAADGGVDRREVAVQELLDVMRLGGHGAPSRSLSTASSAVA